MSSEIEEAFIKYRCDKFQHGYHKFYKNILDRDIESILEIGVKKGKSLACWREVLPTANIFGVDITDKEFVKDLIPSDAKIFICDSTSKKSIEKIGIDSFDVVIDDGCHFIEERIMTFENFKHSAKKYYVIEDVFGENLNYLISYIKSQDIFKNIDIFISKQGMPIDVYRDFLKRNNRPVIDKKNIFSLNMYAVIMRK